MKLPIGKSNFRAIIEENFYFVDKSLLIKEILDDSSEIILITRPRRFGKTLAMSMLQHYFAANVHGQKTSDLFTKLNISQAGENYLRHQGQYPVIFLTLKDIKASQYEACYAGFYAVISKLYAEFDYLLAGEHLKDAEKVVFSSIIERQATREDIHTSLRNLSEYLYRHHGIKPIILLDEYDSPIHAGFTHDYYDAIIELLRAFLGMALKDNPYLYKAVLTGILRISKESLFSGLNNVAVYSILSDEYAAYFGFTEDETIQLLTLANMQQQSLEVKRWYNGYQVGECVLYNPWSILNCVKRRKFRPYWVNTSDDAIIRKLILKSTEAFKEQLEVLLEGKTLEHTINESFVFTDIYSQGASVWTLFLMTGYLKVVSIEDTHRGLLCQLAIPNDEVRSLFTTNPPPRKPCNKSSN